MFRSDKRNLLYLIISSLFSLLLAMFFGNEGYEALLTAFIAMLLFFIWLSISTVKMVWSKKVTIILKLILFPPLLLLLFIFFGLVAFAIDGSVLNPDVDMPSIRWSVIAVAIVPFLFVRIKEYKSKSNLLKNILGINYVIYSMIVFFMALLAFYESVGASKIILVLAVQLQYLMSFVITRTDYFKHSMARILKTIKGRDYSAGSSRNLLLGLYLGLPFLMPILIILVVLAF